ncbi:TPA: cysteine--tRNA ligase [Candidatus Dependentiae bacterium]|nr:MAG: Cysteine-tRNA ligase [candidate division TM6 bacterium GW2011_GWE2_31_21]KKP53806.1 MAG: Cysteine-tRNA ligase [candidate division TM6 bacterium GW2011_GWF2_33_332]HBS47586.1 cysteine--tRNA ligase [Candidatus Dependentiae bacterium]HBZ73735.1 cysteine--tRNA ligase [Candidatus Dependentiae bacterium]
MKQIKLSNTLSKQKDIFTPQEDKKVSMYVCGITPYDYAHIGHGRVAVTFDLLLRLLKLLGYQVTYVRNFTDIDDKLIARAQKEYGDENKFKDVATKFINAFTEDVQNLNCLKPDFEPLVTENINDIILFVEGLLKNKKAYIKGRDVYFDISTFSDYGKLSGRNLEDLLAGARIDVDEDKKNPQDFALWKGNDKSLFWISPWGHGRPGWHIECSALAKKFLGETIDIHGGGMDLIFPHHENEIAQSEGLTCKPFAKYWLHNAFVNINKEKMSKSLGNFFTLRDIFAKFDPMVLRFYYLQHQFRSPIEFSFDDLEAAKKAYKKLIDVFFVDGGYHLSLENSKNFEKEIETDGLISQMLEAVCDDLNSPKMLGILFENLNEIKNDPKLKNLIGKFLFNLTGLTFEKLPEESVVITREIQELIAKREEARKQKNWALADQIRDQLLSMGIEVRDKK